MKPQPNPSQRRAIESLVGPVLVLAGPGTGKTFTLTERIVHLLHQGVDPGRILALTFTDNAAEEMHQRLQARAGLKGRGVPIFTFHGFCNRLIQRHPDVFERSPEIRTADEVTRYKIIREALEKMGPKHLRTERGDIFYYVKEIVTKISVVKREAIRKESFLDCVEAMKREVGETRKAERRLKMAHKLEEFWKVYEAYNEELYRRSLMDYDDMILWVSHVFREREDFLLEVRETYDYLHADEFQDNNSAQNEILYALAGEDPNLFVVGDEDQSIFRFHGACSENMRDFVWRYPNATVVTLNDNHRSTQPILDFAHELMHSGREFGEIFSGVHVDKRLRSSRRGVGKGAPRFVACADRENELVWTVGEIARFKAADASLRWSDIAVLCRRNRELHEMGEALRRHGIPFRLAGNEDCLSSPEAQNLLGLLRAVVQPMDGLILSHALAFPPFEIPFSDLTQLNQLSRRGRTSIWDLLSSDLTCSGLVDMEKVLRVRTLLQGARIAFQKKSLSHAFLEFVHQSGFLSFYLKGAGEADERVLPGAVATLRRLTRFVHDFEGLHPKASLEDFLRHVELAEWYGVALEVDPIELEDEEDAVVLMTAHRAKGSEFAVVVVSQVVASNWEDSRAMPDSIAIPPELVFRGQEVDSDSKEWNRREDERRLLYVAVTRAREHLVVTRPLHLRGEFVDESLFLAELKERHAGKMVWEEPVPLSGPEMARIQLHPLPWGRPMQEFLLEQVRRLRLSATAMYHYETCPRLFLYQHLFQIPARPDRALIYGTVVHEALRRFFNEVKVTGRWPDEKTLLGIYQDQLNLQILESNLDLEELEKLGREDLNRFHEWCLAQPPPRVLETELAVANAIYRSENKSEGEEIRLSGKFDRVDQLPDGTWLVLDYKTGRPKTENEFFGRTKNSDGEHWDQFRFYKLLNEVSGQPKPITRGRVIYLRDPERSHEFELNESHAAEMGGRVKEVAHKVSGLDFHRISENQTAEACRRCTYIHLCRAGI